MALPSAGVTGLSINWSQKGNKLVNNYWPHRGVTDRTAYGVGDWCSSGGQIYEAVAIADASVDATALPGNTSYWKLLGSLISEVDTGVGKILTLSADGVLSTNIVAVTTSAGSIDAGKYVRLNSDGTLDLSFINAISTGITRIYNTVALRNADTTTVWHTGDVAIIILDPDTSINGAYFFIAADQTAAGVTTDADYAVITVPGGIATAAQGILADNSVQRWRATITYGIGDVIEKAGILWSSKTFGNVNNDPETDTSRTNWEPSITDLSYNAPSRQLSSSTGNNVILPLVNGRKQLGADAPGLMSVTDKDTLDSLVAQELPIFKPFLTENYTPPARSGYVEVAFGPVGPSLLFEAEFSTSKFAAGSSGIIENDRTLGFFGGTFGFNGHRNFGLPTGNTPAEDAALVAAEIVAGEVTEGLPNSTWAWNARLKDGVPGTIEISDSTLPLTGNLTITSGGGNAAGWTATEVSAQSTGTQRLAARPGQVFNRGDHAEFRGEYYIYNGSITLTTDVATAFPTDGILWRQVTDGAGRFVHAFNNWNARFGYRVDNIVTQDGLFRRITERPLWVEQGYQPGAIVSFAGDGLLYERTGGSSSDIRSPAVPNSFWMPFSETAPSITNTAWDTFITSASGDVRYQGLLTTEVNSQVAIDQTTNVISIVDTYTKEETYAKTETYTKVETDALINSDESWADYALGGLFVSSTTDSTGVTIVLTYNNVSFYRRIIRRTNLVPYSDTIYSDAGLTTKIIARGE